MAGFYPQFNPAVLNGFRTVKQQLDIDPTYLDHDDCPYDEDIRLELKGLLSPKIIEVPVEKIVEKIIERKVEVAVEAADGNGKKGPRLKGGDGANAEIIGKELTDTLNDLRQLKTNSKALQPKDKLDILKVQAVLLEKLVTAEERNTNIKRMSVFMSTVMGILDDLVDEEKRQTFMRRIQPFVE